MNIEPRNPSWWTILLACWYGAGLELCHLCRGDRKLVHTFENHIRAVPCKRCGGRGWLFVP